MAKRDAELLKVVLVDMRQGAEINIVLGERLGVLVEPQDFQPFPDVGSHDAPPNR